MGFVLLLGFTLVCFVFRVYALTTRFDFFPSLHGKGLILGFRV